MSLRPSAISACTVNEYAPGVAGKPVITPSVEPSVRPGGSAPEAIDHVFASERLDVIASVYGVATVPALHARLLGPMVSFGGGGPGRTPGVMMTETCSSELSLLLHLSVSGSFSSSQNE